MQIITITDSFVALHYTLKNFKALSAYTSDGMLPIDDNELEGQIRTIAPERYNYSFAGVLPPDKLDGFFEEVCY